MSRARTAASVASYDHAMTPRSSHIAVAVALAIAGPFAGAAQADAVRVAAQKTGTLAWELDVVRTHGLDRRAGVKIETLELASPEAGKIALRGGSVDVIVSDWLWVSRERDLGAKLVFHPYSSAVGAVVVPGASPIRSIADLRGKKLAVAGGPIDKSWLLLQGAAKRDGIDLKTQASVVYGAPTLLAEKALQGEVDATLNYWNISAGLEAKGFRRVIGVEDLLPSLGARGRTAMLGYAFDETWAARNRDAVARFLDVTRKAKEILATSDAEWERIAPLVRAGDAGALKAYRDRYRDGIPRRPVEDEEADARALFRILATQGGQSLVGGASELARGTFYRGGSGS
jgi:NitT/TauT family transport system substrate-binding protein